MKPVKMSHTTRILGAPPFWEEATDGKCEGLPISDGDGFIAAYWQTSWRERLLILLGCPVRVSIAGRTTYPLSLDVRREGSKA